MNKKDQFKWSQWDEGRQRDPRHAKPGERPSICRAGVEDSLRCLAGRYLPGMIAHVSVGYSFTSRLHRHGSVGAGVETAGTPPATGSEAKKQS
jgi:hypothetical protein